MTNQIDIISYETWKRHTNPTIYECRDSTKGWIRQTIVPTLIKNGWKVCCQEYNYSLFDKEKPKAMAVRIVLEMFGEEWVKDKQFVYFASRNYQHDFEDCLYIYYKDK